MKRLDFLSRSSPSAAPFQVVPLPALARRASLRFPIGAVVSAAAALGVAGCAQQPPPIAHGPEYFPASVYGQASQRVVADSQLVPRGGGNYIVGRPYTVAGTTYYPTNAKHYSGIGLASWYGDAFHGRRTANGEIYDRNSISAAHPTMPLPSYARVTNLRNHYSIIVRVNDRGPFARGRIMDVSRRVADLLDFRSRGTTRVRIDYVGTASLAGSDDRKLVATLRQDGRLAQLDKRHPPTFAAASQPLQTAAAEIAPVDLRSTVASGESAAPLPATEASFAGPLPLPPSRPFDLGTVPGDDMEMSAAR
jgi:rare lipoprotein A